MRLEFLMYWVLTDQIETTQKHVVIDPPQVVDYLNHQYLP
ncbi:hypothetical protein APA_5421 [Pseudanabaena sp. lw0831]|nr:hypothetical protein APA_5421 [Pseudanabaena sp. lw0831]